MDIIDIASLIISAFAISISGASVFYSTTTKSYEVLINKRMKTYQEIKDCFQKLRKLINEHEILKCGEQNRLDEYCRQLRNKYNQLESLLSQTEPTEFYLMYQVKRMIEMAVGICESGQQCNSIDELEQEAEITFLFADIYCWTLWLYVQGLHKLLWRLASYHRMFDKNFKKVYERAKRLHMDQIPVFFYNYPLEMILGNSSNALPMLGEHMEKQLRDSEKKLAMLKNVRKNTNTQISNLKGKHLQYQNKLKELFFLDCSNKKECKAEIKKLDCQISDSVSKLEKINKDINETEQYRDKLKTQINI